MKIASAALQAMLSAFVFVLFLEVEERVETSSHTIMNIEAI